MFSCVRIRSSYNCFDHYGPSQRPSIISAVNCVSYINRSAVTGRTFQVQAGFGFLPQKSGGFRVNPPDNFFRVGRILL